ncbi:MAG: Eco29kI family restriction endonuclease, partial [Bryobacteraceae bacterium]
PIYVGKAVPAGTRKGGMGLDVSPGCALYNRLSEHAESIQCATNLRLDDFFCRYLAVDDIWIPLGENLLIEMFRPVWNVLIDGFGNHDPGKGRHQGKRPAWDVLHPGRAWASKLQPGKPLDVILKEIVEFFEQGPNVSLS